jgi:enoyl-CoA hydratase
MPDDVVLLAVADRVATITLNRPDARNALSRDVQRLLPALVAEADGRDDVDAIILTGADPAFCAGLDLKELGSGRLLTTAAHRVTEQARPFPKVAKPLIGAINGVAVTGGLELALNCDFLIASERARFGDTHSRVGVQPGWGLTVLLPQAVGVRRAREMSFTGNFIDAAQALAWGLVNHVVPHGELLPTARRLALDIVGNDQAGVRALRDTYDAIHGNAAGWALEHERSVTWQRERFDPSIVAERRAAIAARGRGQ